MSLPSIRLSFLPSCSFLSYSLRLITVMLLREHEMVWIITFELASKKEIRTAQHNILNLIFSSVHAVSSNFTDQYEVYRRVRTKQVLGDLRGHNAATAAAWEVLSQDIPYQRGTYVLTCLLACVFVNILILSHLYFCSYCSTWFTLHFCIWRSRK